LGRSEEVRSRLEANLKASYEVVFFFEYFLETVNKWLSKQLAIGGITLESALKTVESELHSVTSFINSHGLLHFDAHFENILTDGNHLYFTDFGLATCLGFELSQTELEFFETHRLYDRCYTRVHLVNWLGTRLFGKENREAVLRKFSIGNEVENLVPSISSILKRYAPLAVVMNDFFRRYQAETRSAEYPKLHLERLSS
jgi:serine/threonine protein kinase